MARSRKKKKLPIYIYILLLLLLLLALLGAAAVAFVYAQLGKNNRVDPRQTKEYLPRESEFFEKDEHPGPEGATELNPEDVTWETPDETPDETQAVRSGAVSNILLLGQDRRPGEGRARTDSMIVLSINKEKKTIKLISLMRDLYVQIPGYSDNRLNCAYAFGGMELLNRTVELNFGLKIDGNVEVDFDGFQGVVDAIGGVDIYLNESEVAYMQNGNYDVVEGMNHMDGRTALCYARIRKVGNSDWRRTERQRTVITAAFQKLKSADLSTLLALADTVFPLVTTDLTNTQIIGYGMDVLSIGADTLESYRIPQDGAYYNAKIRGMSVLVPDLPRIRSYLQEIIYNQ